MSTTALKITALLFMTADHIGRFIPGAPHFLRIIGRVAAPVFIFCSRWGFDYTKDRKKYLARLYTAGLVTAVGSCMLNSLYPSAYHHIKGNIFVTIFTILFYIWRIESGEKRKLLFGFVNLVGLFVHSFVSLPGYTMQIADGLLPSVFTCEGGILLFIMGILFYYSKEDKDLLKRNYLCFCRVYFILSAFAGGRITGRQRLEHTLLVQNIQWLQVLALPFLLCYNGQKGRGMKWFFYVYYPLHIAVLFIAGNTAG